MVGLPRIGQSNTIFVHVSCSRTRTMDPLVPPRIHSPNDMHHDPKQQTQTHRHKSFDPKNTVESSHTNILIVPRNAVHSNILYSFCIQIQDSPRTLVRRLLRDDRQQFAKAQTIRHKPASAVAHTTLRHSILFHTASTKSKMFTNRIRIISHNLRRWSDSNLSPRFFRRVVAPEIIASSPKIPAHSHPTTVVPSFRSWRWMVQISPHRNRVRQH